MSFRAKLLEHLTALPVTDVKKLVSKYNNELDIKPISKLKKAEILAKISAKKPMDKQLLAKLTNEARATREGKKAQKASEKEAAKKPVEKFGTEKKKIKVKKSKPDFLDLDKDGNKKEPMKKAAKEAKPKSQAEKKIAEVEKILIDLQERKKANEDKQKEIKDLLSKGGKNINKERLEANLETLRKRLTKLESSIVFEKKEIARMKKEKGSLFADKPKKKIIKVKKSKNEPLSKENREIKSELRKIMNKHFGEVIKVYKKVLSDKIKYESEEEEDLLKEAEEDTNEELVKVAKKYKIPKTEDSEFFESDKGRSNIKRIQSLRGHKLGYTTLSNYKELTKINKKLDEKFE